MTVIAEAKKETVKTPTVTSYLAVLRPSDLVSHGFSGFGGIEDIKLSHP